MSSKPSSPPRPPDFTAAELAALVAVADRLIPADEDPSAAEAGFGTFLARCAGDIGARDVGRLKKSAAALDAEAAARVPGATFADLDADARDQLLRDIEAGSLETAWRHALPFLWQMTTLVGRSYYGDPANGGNEGAVSWRRMGFDPAFKRPFTAPERPAITSTPAADVDERTDVVVIGAGAGGGIVACVLAEAGREVLLLERGDWLDHADVSRDHLRNHRFSPYGHNTGPDLDGHPRVVLAGDRTSVVAPHEPGYHNNAMTVGGGTRVYAGQAWRFAPDDFRMRTRYGRPEGSSLADWPIDYTELAPWYERAEREIGVSGECGHSHHGERGPYPMPPVEADLDGPVLRAAAEGLGWNARALPLAINSVPYGGRPACAACGVCVGFSCGTEAKGGSANTVIPRALATGRCRLVTRAQVAAIETDASGQANAVRFVAESDDGRSIERTIRANTIVVAAGAIETARLLLLSADDAHPDGLGNAHDQVGRNLQGHVYNGAVGLHPDVIRTGVGPGNTTATCDFNHGNEGVIGGGLLANEAPFPVHLWSYFAPDFPRWGAAAKAAMANAYRQTIVVMGPIQEIPNPAARVTLDPDVRDRHGLPVARLQGSIHKASIPPAQLLQKKAEAWVRATGATAMRSWTGAHESVLSGGQHQAGTCRMGDDPRESVTDRDGRVHGQESLYLADASLHVTNGGFNPMLTVMANAYRVAEGILRR